MGSDVCSPEATLSQIPTPVIARLARLNLRRASHWHVLLALLATKDTRVATLALMTGLSASSIKGGIATLSKLGIVRRHGGRTGPLKVAFDQLPPPPSFRASGRFTPKQRRAIVACLSKVGRLGGCDAWATPLALATSTRLGLESGTTVRQAYELLNKESTAPERRDFVGIVIDLVQTVTGHELT